MNTPILDFIKKYNDENCIRLHMPGHKGSLEPFDITEINGADVLYNSNGIIAESQKNASKIFETEKTVYSVEGSSLCIRAMLFLIKEYAETNNKKPLILAGRNAHKTFVTASALLNLDVSWLYSENSDFLSCAIDLENLENRITNEKPIALYITSPDYLGNISDISEISKICKKHGVLLIVDNAHGSYLKFLEKSNHPIDLGSDLCCDSAHKTLPVLTGGAYLHISKNAPSFFAENAEKAMSVFASTSPSYLILQSLDYFNEIASVDFKDKTNFIANKLAHTKIKLIENGYLLIGNEPFKITISSKSYGFRGYELASLLENHKIIPEFYDNDFLVLMFSTESKISNIDYVCDFLLSISKKDAINEKPPKFIKMKNAITPYHALFSASEYVSVENAEGRILASPCVSCPPAVCVAVCGEILNSSAIEMFKYYGINDILVVIE